MSLYDDAFDKLGYRVAQVLLTEEDFADAKRHENLRATLETLLKLGVIPIINENDTVSTAELGGANGAKAGASKTRKGRIFGDNDKLSALVMQHIGAGLLVLLSDVEGVYAGDPRVQGAKLVEKTPGVTEELLRGVRAATRRLAKNGSGRGRGGMDTKLEAARIATDAGCLAVIANGRTPGILDRVCAGQPVGTLFFPGKRT